MKKIIINCFFWSSLFLLGIFGEIVAGLSKLTMILSGLTLALGGLAVAGVVNWAYVIGPIVLLALVDTVSIVRDRKIRLIATKRATFRRKHHLGPGKFASH